MTEQWMGDSYNRVSTQTGPIPEDVGMRHGAVILLASTDTGPYSGQGFYWQCQCGVRSKRDFVNAAVASSNWANHVAGK